MPALWARLRIAARRIRRDAVTLWLACQDARTPWRVRLLAALVVAYALSPIDLVPDFIPVLGYLDELLLLPGLIWLVLRLMPPPLLHACRARARAWCARHGQPVSRWGAVGGGRMGTAGLGLVARVGMISARPAPEKA